MQKSPVSFLTYVARLPKNGLPVMIEADEQQRERLAADHELNSVTRFHADLLVTPWKAGGIRVTGTVDADIVQICVVTLDPIEVHIAEGVEGTFVPENSKLAKFEQHASSELVLDAEGPDAPEVFSGDTIDVGAFAEEFFALAIDPYPRKPGAGIGPAPADPDADEGPNPFAKLGVLRPKA